MDDLIECNFHMRTDFFAHSEGDIYVCPFTPIEDLAFAGYWTIATVDAKILLPWVLHSPGNEYECLESKYLSQLQLNRSSE